MNRIILGIDPGTATLGYGVIQQKGNRCSIISHGCVKTLPKVAMEKRLAHIHKELENIIKEFAPTEIAIEQIFFSKNVKTAISVAQARGIALLSAAQAEVVVAEYTPNQVKSAVCGYGQADKKQVQYMVKRLLNLSDVIKSDDAADALAIALCHAQSKKELKIKK